MISPSSGHGADVSEIGSMWSELEVLYKRRDRRYSTGFCEPDDSGYDSHLIISAKSLKD